MDKNHKRTSIIQILPDLQVGCPLFFIEDTFSVSNNGRLKNKTVSVVLEQSDVSENRVHFDNEANLLQFR